MSDYPLSPYYLSKCLRVIMLDSEEQCDRLIAGLTRVLEREPRNVIAMSNRGVAHWERGYIDRALDDLSRAIEMDVQAESLMARGDLLTQLQRVEEALIDYTAAIRMEPNDPYFRRTRASLLHRLGRFAEAVADYDVAIEIAPEFQRTRKLRARAQAGLAPD